MKLLLLCMNYAPEPTGIAPFTTALAQELVARGHIVTVATTFPHYPEWRTHPAYQGKWFMQETINGVIVRRTRVLLPNGAGALKRVLYDSSLSIGNFWVGLSVRDVDLVLGVEPPIQTGVVARVLAGLKGVPFALWVHDLAVEAAMSVGMLKPSLALRLAHKLEQWAHRAARKIFVISEGFRDNLMAKGTPASKLVYLPNWMADAAPTPMSGENVFRHSHGLCDDAVIVLHSGNMGVKQQLENVLAAAERLHSTSDLCFVMVGDGSQKASLVEYAERQALANVRFLPLQPNDMVPAMMAAADILLVNQHPDMTEAVIPSKLLTYMTAARPIVIAAHPDSEAARQVRAGACGIVVMPDNPDALAQAIVHLANNPAQRQELGAHGRTFVETHFARKPLLDRFEQELLTLTN